MNSSLCTKLNRKKKIDSDFMNTPLKRCLTTFDICFLGVGQMVGTGIYVLTGAVAKNLAGPGVILSFLIAGLAALLTATCYAEFGSRIPRAGSAYVYTYVTIGEFWSFLVGWNIILEFMIAAASVARAWSGYLDTFFNGAIQNGTSVYVGEIHVGFFDSHPDFIASSACLILGACLTAGIKESTYLNTVFTTVNMFVVCAVVAFGFFWVDVKNWRSVPGGFLPYGFAGVMRGASACYFGFTGFDIIATSGEEAKNPQRSIPAATFIAMGFVSLSYFLISGTLTLMVPYNDIHPTAALPEAFGFNNAAWAKYIIATGALAGMTSGLFGALFGLARCLYAMSTDGLLFQIFSKIDSKLQVPVVNVITSSICTSFIALLFELEKLVELMSIGTLAAFTIVNVNVIILRYQPSDRYTTFVMTDFFDLKDELTTDSNRAGRLKPQFEFLERHLEYANVNICVSLMTVSLAAVCGVLKLAGHQLSQGIWWAVILFIIFVGSAFVCLLIISLHEQSSNPLVFKVPLVPWIPALSIFLNLALMTYLNYTTWIRFAIWTAVGLLVYFGYSIRHSKENELVIDDHTGLLATPVVPRNRPWALFRINTFDDE